MNKLIALMGTNASGKSSLGIKLAQFFGGEIVSADSRQVFSGLDLGSGKVTIDEQKIVPHHLLDVVAPNDKFSVADFQKLAYSAIDDIIARSKPAFLVGGTGLYVRAVTDGYHFSELNIDEDLRKQREKLDFDELKNMILSLDPKCDIDFSNISKRRMVRVIEKLESGNARVENTPRYEVLKLGLSWDKEILKQRILDRFDKRVEDGMVREVENLLKEGATPEFLIGLGLEYRHIYYYITGVYKSYDEFKSTLVDEICKFAKRQMTWFRKEKNIIWLDETGDYFEQAKILVQQFLNK